ncbi:MAG: aminoglycoside phosphotransferase family protein, partial [Cellulomonadaceae bacterium]|nr:aminoglycoside phosphotransferase family protein [Cellulomonadaceae bacterium]
MTPEPSIPLAFSGSRLGWGDLPRPVRARIAELAGAEVVVETSATSGFSPGYAALLELGDGTEVFVKAVSPEQNPESPDLARAEVRVAAHLPDAVPAPPLLWSSDDGSWVILGFVAVQGRSPQHPWQPDELDRTLGALTDLAAVGTPGPEGLRALSGEVAVLADGWAQLADAPVALARAVEQAGEHGPWMRDHLDELAGWA